MTLRIRRVVGGVAVAFGLVGVVVCGAGAYAAWRVQARLDRANDLAFDAVDRGLSEVQERVPLVRERLGRAKGTTGDVGDAVRGWATSEARDRVVSALQIESRAATLSAYLQTADARLDASAATVRDIRRLLELTGVPAATQGPAATDTALELLATLRGKLDEAEGLLAEVRRLASDGGGPVESALARVTQALARILAGLTAVESRLDEFAARLTDIRGEARHLQVRTGRYILLGAVACYAVLAWAAAGQIALCRWGLLKKRLNAQASIGNEGPIFRSQ